MKKISLLILILTFLLIPTCVNANTSAINWSETSKSISDTDFKEIITHYTEHDVTSENFSTWTPTDGSYFAYDSFVLSRLRDTTYAKAFYQINDNEILLLFNQNNFTLSYEKITNISQQYYYINCDSIIFNFQNKTITYKYGFKNEYYNDLNNKGWNWYTSDVTETEFLSYAYKQNMMYRTFFLVVGPFYDNNNNLLNTTISYKVTNSTWEEQVFSGDISFSEDKEAWLTTGLSDNFKLGFYEYYIEAYDYSESGISKVITEEIKISDATFLSNSVYMPTIEEVNGAIKEIDGYMNYVYTITLRPQNQNLFLLSSEIFILDSKPIDFIEYFNLKYDYFDYSNYINIGNNPSNSGDSGNGNIVGDIEERK